ncbi:MAG TPA: hypothetical protein VKD90_30570 [Gemmataceae bacterium]|nr:hypothetical protein [Gemmataceae bacterium]
MKWVGCGLLAGLLALPAAWGDDPPNDKDRKEPAKDEKTLTPKERYDALVKEFRAKQKELAGAYQKAKEADEKQKILTEFRGIGGQFADRFAKLADDDPKGPIGTDAAFWILQNVPASNSAHEKATEKVKAFVADTPLKDLVGKLKDRRGAPPAVLDAALARAEKEEKDPASADLTGWVAKSAPLSAAGKKATGRMLEKYPDHPDIDQVVAMIARMAGKDADTRLKALLENDSKRVKAAANLALARKVADKVDDLADQPGEADKVVAEAEKYFTAAIEFYKDNAEPKKQAEIELNAMRHLRVGKEALDIKGPDLDGKEFKLSDYRGKVVLLDFWGNW